MASIESNRAAWLVSERADPLQVSSGPDQTKAEENEVIIRVAAIAINPSEPHIQAIGISFLQLKFPHVLGSDIAGTVVKVGSNVSLFQPGDRVIGHCLGLMHGGARHGGFQEFAACLQTTVAKIPESLPFAHAAVLPLSISTSATALYEHLQLRQPTVEPTKTGKDVVLIWGGATSIGSSAIQMAVASGYKVITTASAKNHEYVKSLVVTGKEDVTVLDYADADISRKIIAHIKDHGLDFSGVYDCVSKETTVRVCVEVAGTFGGHLVSTVLPGVTSPREDVELRLVWATSAGMVADGGQLIWKNFVTPALENGTLKAKPEPQIVGEGLEKIQEAMNLYKKGVSATKLVVTL
ncbi:chaperonin 10-like protein [Truncatella angustata]|uniref:Chaperonin 10-like protein n=1 Tax=Truncatella angustata TaxID=152316 RepID=A0A9P8UTQ1_9PEZI|nr:chaperonin 10-like protein [Truncatella angustata]KAH6658029.1 chaperonin 10-like protein [Truncatella angustata]